MIGVVAVALAVALSWCIGAILRLRRDVDRLNREAVCVRGDVGPYAPVLIGAGLEGRRDD